MDSRRGICGRHGGHGVHVPRKAAGGGIWRGGAVAGIPPRRRSAVSRGAGGLPCGAIVFEGTRRGAGLRARSDHGRRRKRGRRAGCGAVYAGAGSRGCKHRLSDAAVSDDRSSRYRFFEEQSWYLLEYPPQSHGVEIVSAEYRWRYSCLRFARAADGLPQSSARVYVRRRSGTVLLRNDRLHRKSAKGKCTRPRGCISIGLSRL